MKTVIYKPTFFMVKIRDGLFLGDRHSPQQRDFLLCNKITTIINCSASQLKIPTSLITQLSLRVASFQWRDSDIQTLLDSKDISITTISGLVDRAMTACEGVLVCSSKGDSRPLTVIAAYLMKRMCWSLYKTLQYLNSRHAEFEIRSNFLGQLMEFEKRLLGGNAGNVVVTKNWVGGEKDELAELTRNTYLNSIVTSQTNMEQGGRHRTQKVKFAENLVTVIQEEKKVVEMPIPVVQDFRQYQDSMMGSLQIQQNQGTPRKPHFQTTTPTPKNHPNPPPNSHLHPKNPSSYRIRRHSQKHCRTLPSEPTQQVYLNINFNINSINIVSDKINQRLQRRSITETMEKDPFETTDKLRMYLRATPKRLRWNRFEPITPDNRRQVSEHKRNSVTELSQRQKLKRIVFKKEIEM